MTLASAAFTRTAPDIVAEVLMTRAVFSGAILLLEGPSDSRLFGRHLLAGCTQIVICGGKVTALKAISLLVSVNVDGCVAIVDRDYDDHLGKSCPPNVFFPDTHDSETLMLSRRLSTVLAELGDTTKKSTFELSNGFSVEDALLSRSEYFSKLRFLNDVVPGFSISLDPFSPWKYFDIASWTINHSRLKADYAANCGVSLADIISADAGTPRLNSWIDVNGHDTLAILSIGLRHLLGTGKQVTEPSLMTALRLAFSEADFKQTMLFAQLKVWEQATGGQPLLAP